MTRGRETLDALGASLLVVGVAVSLTVVPRREWSRTASLPTQAVYVFLLALVVIALARVFRRPRLERACLALLLAAMPVVYVRAVLLGGESPGMRVWPEALGLVLFVAAAVGGYLRPPLLAAGILAHGLAWDLWHLGAEVVPDWYAVACAVVDVSLGTYAASRLPEWSSSGGCSATRLTERSTT